MPNSTTNESLGLIFMEQINKSELLSLIIPNVDDLTSTTVSRDYTDVSFSESSQTTDHFGSRKIIKFGYEIANPSLNEGGGGGAVAPRGGTN